jgi:hypothetical protein
MDDKDDDIIIPGPDNVNLNTWKVRSLQTSVYCSLRCGVNPRGSSRLSRMAGASVFWLKRRSVRVGVGDVASVVLMSSFVAFGNS